MTASSNSLIFNCYTPALRDDLDRPASIAHAMEFAFPGLRLQWTITNEGQFIALPQRDAWLAQESSRGEFPLLCNGDENHLVTLSGLAVPANIAAGGQPLLHVHAEMPMDKSTIMAGTEVLMSIAEAARAHWGHATPDSVGLEIALQTSRPLYGPHRPPRGLPVLKRAETLRSAEIPHCLGWLNYWSAATARTLGFPDPLRDADLLSRSRQTASGGWVVQLTDAPLELDRPEHLKVLLHAYERFPEIGGRSPRRIATSD